MPTLARASPALLCSIACSLLTLGCGDAMLRGAQAYESRHALGLAREYALGAAPSDERVAALARLNAAYGRQLKDDALAADAQNDTRTAVTATLARVELEPVTAELQRAISRAHAAGLADLDRRSQRGEATPADLVACRRTAAWLPKDQDTARRCEAMRNRLRLNVAVSVTTAAAADASAVADEITRAFGKDRYQLLQGVSANADDCNAELRVDLSAPARVTDTGFVEIERRPLRDMVPTGKKEKVKIDPTPQEIEDAKKAGKPPPEPKLVDKALYEPAYGEYRLYRRTLRAEKPYAFVLERLRGRVTVRAGAGVLEASVDSRYFEYSGARALRRDPAGFGEGRGSAATLPMPDDFARATETRVPARVAEQVIGFVEGQL